MKKFYKEEWKNALKFHKIGGGQEVRWDQTRSNKMQANSDHRTLS